MYDRVGGGNGRVTTNGMPMTKAKPRRNKSAAILMNAKSLILSLP